MAKANGDTLWPLEPHTEAKHRILARYLKAWFPILSRWNGRVLYLDGFAGPGEYEGGEPGSPVIAIRIAAEHKINLEAELVFLFVESRPDRFDHLSQKLDNEFSGLPPNIRVYKEKAEFADVLTQVLDDLDEKGHGIAPTFAFIDPFGTKGVPMDLVHRLLERPHTEVFINFNTRGHYRFGDHPLTSYRENEFEAFGTEEIAEIGQATDRAAFARDLYERKLKEKAQFVRLFSMLDSRNVPIYDLFFATNNIKGFIEMKNAMWSVDSWGDYRFTDATERGLPILFEPQPELQLKPRILSKWRGKTAVQVETLREWVERETGFLTKHLKAALWIAENEGEISVREGKADGRKRHGRTFPDAVIVDFKA